MQVIQNRFEDAGEQDESGHFEFYYSGVIYRFVFPTRALIARRYDDTIDEASFIAIASPLRDIFTEVPYGDPEFREAVAFLRNSQDVKTVMVLLSQGYVPIDLTQLPT